MRNTSPRTFGPELVRWADAAIGGALFYGVVEALLMCRRGWRGLGAVVALLALHLLAAIPVLLALACAGLLAARVDAVLGRRSRLVVAAVVSLVLAAPALSAASGLSSAARGGLFWAACAGVAAVASGAFVVVRRGRSPAAWLFGALVAYVVARTADLSMRLPGQLHRLEANQALAVMLASALASIVWAAAVASLLAPGEGPRVRWRIGSAVVGVGLTVVAVMFRHLMNPTTKAAVCMGSYALLAVGATVLSAKGAVRHRLWLLLPAPPVVAYLALALALPSPIPWTLATRTSFASEILVRTGLMRGSVTRYARRLGETFEAEGRAAEAPASAPAATRPVPAQRPVSILLITADALRYDHVGYSGKARPGLTPRLDAFAERSQRFHRVYPQGGWTSLSIPALLWSRYPKDLRFVPLFEDIEDGLYLERDIPPGAVLNQRYQSPIEEPTENVAEVLGAAGFATIAVTNDGGTDYFDPRLGFARGFGKVVYPKRACPPATERSLADVPGFNDACTVELAAKELASVGSGRFFLWVHLFGSHGPHRPAADEAPFVGYEAQVHEDDRHVGALLDALAAVGRDRDTVVVVTGDHGEELQPGAPLNGHHGLSLTEASLRVPLLVAVPGLAPRDVSSPEVGLVDVVPTVLGLAAVPVPAAMQGRDLAPLLATGDVGEWPPAFAETWRLEVSGARNIDLIAGVQGGAKVVLDVRSWALAFYEVTDPGESRDLYPDPAAPSGAADSRRFDRLALRLLDWYGLRH